MHIPLTTQLHRYELNNLNQTLALIDALAASGSNCTLTRLAEQTGLNKNRVFRLLVTLENRGIVEKNQQGEYRFGSTAFKTARKIMLSESIVAYAHPVMQELAAVSQEAVYLAMPAGTGAIMVDMIDSCLPIRATSFVGSLIDLAGESAEQFKGTDSLGTEIIVNRGGLDMEVVTMSAVLRGQSEDAVGVLVMLAPVFRMSNERIIGELIPLLGKAARQLSHRIGVLAIHRSHGLRPKTDEQMVISHPGMPDGYVRSNVHRGFQG